MQVLGKIFTLSGIALGIYIVKEYMNSQEYVGRHDAGESDTDSVSSDGSWVDLSGEL